ncbi:RNA-guided endonuclease InsQ/TnpB family protein [Mycolicibacterium neworleansense]|uniref:Transposase n=1 Tax=Mycolicibacterium neworleansense TaxID=146018 RepID=A0A0H5S9P2_9MYCO|nr:RNA-guided endonuclease TnpB family protein [Mycolicibacterium neworleansense]MCV7362478.1 IS200/IS605 family element transposase accessory protein TnpB [Mycolicibacterium neworleansense]CRZ18069.1 transposase [Mycolicibacterium neworleansense]
MSRHTTFRFCLNPTVEQYVLLSRHTGASRFAFNQCLQFVKTALTVRDSDSTARVPWTGFDLINAFNTWKITADAGRTFTVDGSGAAQLLVTGLAWRNQICQQVFEEAAVDLGNALKAWSDSCAGRRGGARVGFPKFKKKTRGTQSLRLRNKHSKGRPSAIRVGDHDRPRSITLPGLGQIAVHDDTRRLRRLLAKNRARILFATISNRGGRWWASLTVEAADFHAAHRHPTRDQSAAGDWVGIDRGLSSFAVAATSDGTEVVRTGRGPRALGTGMKVQRQLAKSLSRKEKGSRNRRIAAAKLARHHYRVANIRRHFLHQVSNAVVKTHDRLVIEDLNVSGMRRNRQLARAISDAGWAEFARMLGYKQAWRGGELIYADRWFPSSRLCSVCGERNATLTLADRTFVCPNGHEIDRDTNAATNLAQWGEAHTNASPEPRTPKHGGRAINARRRDGAGLRNRVGETDSDDAGTDVHPAPAA